MFRPIKWFLKNELKGLEQIGKIFVNALKAFGFAFFRNQQSMSLSDTENENAKKAVQAINESSKITPDHVNVLLNPFEDNDHSPFKGKIVNLSLKTLESKTATAWTYAHELGHVKHHKFHNAINLVNLPYSLLYRATTVLYQLGALAYPVVGNSVFNFTNNCVSHVAPFLIASGTVNAISIRLREYQADIFAYKQTGLLPSENLKSDYRNGIIGNLSESLSNVVGGILSGYPLPLERDIVVKIFASKPKKTSFVEGLQNDRKTNNQEQRPFL